MRNKYSSNTFLIVLIQKIVRKFLFRKSNERERLKNSMLNENKEFYENMKLERMNTLKNDIISKIKTSGLFNKHHLNFQNVMNFY